MTSELPNDPILDRLSRLPAAALPGASAERIRARSHAALAKRQRRSLTPATGWRITPRFGVGIVDYALMFVGLMYLAGAVGMAIQRGVLR